MHRMDRRSFIRLTAASAAASAVVLRMEAISALAGMGAPAKATAATESNRKKDGVFDQAEARTRRILSEMEERLERLLAESDAPFSDEVRMRLTRAAMWPPFSGLAQDFLQYLGDSAEFREKLSFLMPFVRWMSEPFLFPLETDGSSDQQAREVEKVFRLMTDLRGQGFTVSLDNVGDASLSPEEACAYRDYYLFLIRAFAASKDAEELNLSLKLSALTHDLNAALDPGEAGKTKRWEIIDALAELLTAAAQAPDKNIFVRIDMEEYAYKDLTLNLFRETVEKHPDISVAGDGNLRLGVVIQAYLRDSAADVRGLMAWARPRGLRVPIRLVKGAYLDHERAVAAAQGRPSPVWDNKPSTDANFEALSACLLLKLNWVVPAFATHNLRSQAHAMALTEAYSLPQDAARIQMLYGMGDPIKRVVVTMGRPLREYVPAGSLARGLKYAGRRFNELANGDNALARTLRGDFSGVNGSAPAFVGEKDMEDSKEVRSLLERSLAEFLRSHAPALERIRKQSEKKMPFLCEPIVETQPRALPWADM